jgi:hypothetical protein
MSTSPAARTSLHTQPYSCSTMLLLSSVVVQANGRTLSVCRAWLALQLPPGVAAAGTAICALMMCPAASRCSAYCGLVRAAARHAALMDVKTGGWSGRVTRQRYNLQHDRHMAEVLKGVLVIQTALQHASLLAPCLLESIQGLHCNIEDYSQEVPAYVLNTSECLSSEPGSGSPV